MRNWSNIALILNCKNLPIGQNLGFQRYLIWEHLEIRFTTTRKVYFPYLSGKANYPENHPKSWEKKISFARVESHSCSLIYNGASILLGLLFATNFFQIKIAYSLHLEYMVVCKLSSFVSLLIFNHDSPVSLLYRRMCKKTTKWKHYLQSPLSKLVGNNYR